MTADASTDSPRRRPKGDKRARTRARIVEAARDLVSEKGYENTSVQDVARRAGLSNGAIYGNFRNREELFAAIGPAYWPQVRVDVKPGMSFAEIMDAMAEATIAAFPARRRAGVGRLTGLTYALRNAELQRIATEQTARRTAAVAAWWRSVLPEDELPMAPERLVWVLNALVEGLTLQWLLTPELVGDEVVRAAFAALAAGASPARRQRR